MSNTTEVVPTNNDPEIAPSGVVDLKPKDYKGPFENIWCPGCGDFGVLSSLYMAFSKMKLNPKDVTIISGIGCSGRLPGYVATYGFNGVHGRALPVATGVKLARPDITVLAVGGDGDAFAIGAGHIPHASRRNVDITYIVMDNEIYGLTKGQASPTTPEGDETPSSLWGVKERPVNPVAMMLTYGVTFIARSFSMDARHHADMVQQAIEHKGFSFVHSISPCTTFRGGKAGVEAQKGRLRYLDENHDPTDFDAAWKIAMDRDTINVGVIYKEDAPTLDQEFAELREQAKADGAPPPVEIINQFYP